MGLKYNDVIKDLDKVFEQMMYQEIDIDAVGHVGKRTKPLGLYFAKGFDCDCVQLPSANRKGKNSNLAKIVNSIYPFLPEIALRPIVHQYKNYILVMIDFCQILI